MRTGVPGSLVGVVSALAKGTHHGRDQWRARTSRHQLAGSAAASIRRCTPTADELASMERPQVARIRTEGLGKRYGGPWAVRDLDLSVGAGEVFGFLGPNGAGKSTTIRLLLGMARPTAGQAWLAGHPRRRRGASARARGVCAGRCGVVAASDRAGGAGAGRASRAASRTWPTGRSWSSGSTWTWTSGARTYSSGNRQKVALVAAFATRAPVLILDEPTSGLDPLMERAFRVAVGEARDAGQTVFVSSHQLGEVEAICDRVGILRAGQLVEVAGLDQLRRLRRVEIDVRFTGDHSRAGRRPARCRAWREARQVGDRHLVLQLTGGAGLGPVAAAAGRRRPGRVGCPGAVAGGDLPGVLRGPLMSPAASSTLSSPGRGRWRGFDAALVLACVAAGAAGCGDRARSSRRACRRWWCGSTAAWPPTASTPGAMRALADEPGHPDHVRATGRPGRPGRLHRVADRDTDGGVGGGLVGADRGADHPR